MIVYDIINDIIDVCHDGYRYLSNIKCIYVGILLLVISIDICQTKNMDIFNNIYPLLTNNNIIMPTNIHSI